MLIWVKAVATTMMRPEQKFAYGNTDQESDIHQIGKPS